MLKWSLLKKLNKLVDRAGNYIDCKFIYFQVLVKLFKNLKKFS